MICFGDYNCYVNEGIEEDIFVKCVIVYFDYNKIFIDSDIVLIQLFKLVILNVRVKIVCLFFQDEVVFMFFRCFIMGLFSLVN